MATGGYGTGTVTASRRRRLPHIINAPDVCPGVTAAAAQVSGMATRTITTAETDLAQETLGRARRAMDAIASYDQATVDRLCQAVAWSTANLETSTRLANMSVDESGLGSREPSRRGKVLGILRDALREKSMGVIEELPEKGIVKYAKPAGVICALIPVTSPYITPIGIAIYAIKCKDAVIFSPHPSSRKTTFEVVRLMRGALRRQGVPEDVLQCVERPSIPLANELMSICDLTIATGGPAMVKAAYGSGKPAFGVGAGNATMVIDETADIEEAARNTRLSKTNDYGSGCSADGNLLVDASIYDRFVDQLQQEGGYLVAEREKALLQAAYWDTQRRRTVDTIARSAEAIAAKAGIVLPAGKTFFIVPETHIGKQHPFSTEKLGVVLAVFKYHGFDDALDKVRQIFETGGKGHSCGIYSFDDDHIHRLALIAPVSRIMVRQVQSRSNAGTFTNGMPMTSSMGCGIWGGNITNENIALKHYMNVTWVSRPITEDKPSDQELFGEFYNSEILQ
jgi:sulfoacetaldehyde dehydrogenase